MQIEKPYGNQGVYHDQPLAEEEEDEYQYGNEYDDVLPPDVPTAPPPPAVPDPTLTATPTTETVSLEALQQMLPKVTGVQQTADGDVVLNHDIRQTAFIGVCCVLRSLGKSAAAEALFLKWRRHYSTSPAGSKEFLDAYVMLQGAAQFSEAAMLDVLKEDFKLPV